MTKKALITMCVTFALLSLTGAALALSGVYKHHHNRSAAGDRKRLTRTVDPRLVKHLGIFRQARSTAVGAMDLPAATQVVFNEQLAPSTGANLALARKAGTSTDPVYIVPGDGTVCQIGGGGMACGSIADFGQDPRTNTLFSYSMKNPPNTIDVSGIVPDDVTAIDAVRPDGSTVSIPVSNNAFSTLIPANATSLAYHTSDRGVLTSEVSKPPH